MKKLLPVAFLTVFYISGCLTPKKMNKWTSEHYSEINNTNTKTKAKPDYLSITSPLVLPDQPVSTTEKTSKNLLPLLFYWKCDYYLTCVLNPKVPVSLCSAAIKTYAGSKGLRQKLNNASIQLSIDSVPNTFALFERDHLVWVILYAFSWYEQAFTPQHKDLVVAYKVTDNGRAVIKNGTITIPDENKNLNVKYLHSVRKTENDFLDQYDENIKVMSRKAVDELMHELQ